MSRYSQLYDPSYDPPAPVVEIVVRAPEQQTLHTTLTALVDSGADGTLIPHDVLQAVGARYAESRQMRGIGSGANKVDLYTVTIQIGPHLVHGIRAIAVARGAEALVGRDVLNQLVVTLDGLAGVTEVDS